jgi:hypothetical protein
MHRLSCPEFGFRGRGGVVSRARFGARASPLFLAALLAAAWIGPREAEAADVEVSQSLLSQGGGTATGGGGRLVLQDTLPEVVAGIHEGQRHRVEAGFFFRDAVVSAAGLLAAAGVLLVAPRLARRRLAARRSGAWASLSRPDRNPSPRRKRGERREGHRGSAWSCFQAAFRSRSSPPARIARLAAATGFFETSSS